MLGINQGCVASNNAIDAGCSDRAVLHATLHSMQAAVVGLCVPPLCLATGLRTLQVRSVLNPQGIVLLTATSINSTMHSKITRSKYATAQGHANFTN